VIRTILCPVTGGREDEGVLLTAFRVARQFGAHVDVLFARLSAADTVPVIGEGLSSSVIDQILEAAERDWRQRWQAARSAFDKVRAGFGAGEHDTPPGPGTLSTAWRERVGREDLVVRHMTALSDLVVLRHEADSEEDVQLSMTAEAALLQGGRPVLVVPGIPPQHVGGSIAIAWNGRPQCARAVSGAMPFLKEAQAVHVLTAPTHRTDGNVADELVDYLAWHGIEAQAHRVEPGVAPVGAALLGTAAELGADLLVMGGYGHSRFREMVLGGVTRFVMTNAGLPVLMAH
jgi:nucleotide-binding universal stress UspA family protein